MSERWALRHPDGTPYLTRTVLAGVDCLDTHDPACLVHEFIHEIHSPDSDPDMHDHPWAWAVAVVLSGGYREARPGENGLPWTRTYRAGDLNVLRPGDYHRITAVEPGTRTHFIAGREISDWGFLVNGVHVPHRDYLRGRPCITVVRE
jgi:hypothetical protein